jgi:hypothetical protein
MPAESSRESHFWAEVKERVLKLERNVEKWVNGGELGKDVLLEESTLDYNTEKGHSCFGPRALMRIDGFSSFLFFVPRSPTSKICSPFSQFLFLDFGFLGSGDSAMLLCLIGLCFSRRSCNSET